MNSSAEFDGIYNAFCANIIEFFKQKRQFFSIVCDIERVRFEPPLSEEILKGFGSGVKFAIAYDTFESLEIFNDGLHPFNNGGYVHFAAGFGSDNVVSKVTVEIRGIYQISTNNTQDMEIVAFMRLDSKQIFTKERLKGEEQLEDIKDLNNDELDSLKAIISSDENRELLKSLKSALKK